MCFCQWHCIAIVSLVDNYPKLHSDWILIFLLLFMVLLLYSLASLVNNNPELLSDWILFFMPLSVALLFSCLIGR